MREIKFRVWIEKLSCYADSALIGHDGGFIAYKDGVQYVNGDLEQFSGLRDKKGRDIYEGDIVTGDSWKEPYAMRTKKQVIGRVVFADSYGFMFTTNNIDGTYRGLPKGCRTYPNLNRCEVIGNIHENGDLLK